jgi:hypothetical protein
VGYILLNSDRVGFRGAAGVTYTSEDYTVDDRQDGSFLGARVGWDFHYALLSTTTFTHSLIFDRSFENRATSGWTPSSACAWR